MSGADDPDREGGFLSGWSRRKLAAKRQVAAPEAAGGGGRAAAARGRPGRA